MHLIDFFHAAADRWPERVSLHEGEETRTCRSAQAAARDIGRSPRAKGIAASTCVAVVGPNAPT